MEWILETKRLYLRNLGAGDVEMLFGYRNDKRCYKFQRWEDTSLAGLREFVEDFKNDVFLSDREEQHYAICTREGMLAGDLSYFYTEADRCVTLGITVSGEHHRKGYAFELLGAVVDAIRRRHPSLDIVALIDRENLPSIALFEKLGFVRECYAESIASYVYVINGINRNNS